MSNAGPTCDVNMCLYKESLINNASLTPVTLINKVDLTCDVGVGLDKESLINKVGLTCDVGVGLDKESVLAEASTGIEPLHGVTMVTESGDDVTCAVLKLNSVQKIQ